MKKIIVIFILASCLSSLSGLKIVDKLRNRFYNYQQEVYHYQVVMGDPNELLSLKQSIYLTITGQIKSEEEIDQDSLVIVTKSMRSYEQDKVIKEYSIGDYLSSNLRLISSVYGQYESKILYSSSFLMAFRKFKNMSIDENFTIASYQFGDSFSQEELEEITNPKLKEYLDLSPCLPLQENQRLKITFDYFKNGLLGKEECSKFYSKT